MLAVDSIHLAVLKTVGEPVGPPFIFFLQMVGEDFPLNLLRMIMSVNTSGNSMIMTTGELPMDTGFEKTGPDVFIRKNGALQKDPLADDLSLLIETEVGLIIILGCAHRGIINTLYYAQKLTGNKTVYAAIGMAHLFCASEIQIEQTVAASKDMGIKRLGLSHCTGVPAATRLSQEMPDAVFLNNAGTSLTLS